MYAPRWTRIALGALIAISVGWGAFFIHRTSFELGGVRVFCLWDDAMISMHYARNLAEGDGLVWNRGEDPVQGISNPGVALAMAALHGLPIAPHRMALVFQGLALGAFAGILALVFRLASRWFPARWDLALASVAATALCGPLAFWTLVGSDVGFVALWALAGVVAIAEAEAGRLRRLPEMLVLLGPGLLLRPDAILFYALIAGAAATLPDGRRAVLAGVATAAVLIGGWAAFGVAYYGDALPNTYYLKATGHPRGEVLTKGVELLGVWLPRLAAPLVVAGAGWFWHRTGRARASVNLAAAMIGASILYSVWVGGDWLASHGIRFLVPTLPLAMLLMTGGVAGIAERAWPREGRARRVGVAAGVVALAVLANAPATLHEWLGLRVPTLREDNRASVAFARYIARYTDPTTSLGVHWAGAPIYFSRRPGVDLLGRSDRHIARQEGHAFRPGHSKWDWDYVLNERRPDVLRDVSRGLADRADFRSQYVQVTRGRLGFYMRRDTLGKLRDPQARIHDLETAERLAWPPR